MQTARLISVPALLVSIGAPRLRRLGLPEKVTPSAEHRLYALLGQSEPDRVHSRYHALVRRLVSYERAAECASQPILRQFAVSCGIGS